jgi:hypothetical protein
LPIYRLDRASRRKLEALRRPEYHALATYNAEVARGIVHTPEYDEYMAQVQRDWKETYQPAAQKIWDAGKNKERVAVSDPHDRLMALLKTQRLPDMIVDTPTYRRLRDLQDRMTVANTSLLKDADGGFDHVIYATILAGLLALENEDGVIYDEYTGERLV